MRRSQFAGVILLLCTAALPGCLGVLGEPATNRGSADDDLNSEQMVVPIYRFARSESAGLVATCGTENAIEIRRLTGEQVASLRYRDYRPTCLSFADTEGELIAGYSDGSVLRWRPEGDSYAPQLLTRHSDTVRNCQVSQGGEFIMSVDQSGEIYVRSTREDWAVVRKITQSATVLSARISANGQFLAVACMDGCVRVWSVATGKLLHRLPTSGIARTVSISPDDRTIVAGDANGNVHFWNTESGAKRFCKHSFRSSYAVVHGVKQIEFSPDGRLLAINRVYEKEVCVFETTNMRPVYSISAHPLPVSDFAFVGDELVTSGYDGRIQSTSVGKMAVSKTNRVKPSLSQRKRLPKVTVN